jgi:hypothetical protein
MKSRLAVFVCLLAPMVVAQDGAAVASATPPAPSRAVEARRGTVRRTLKQKGTVVPAEKQDVVLDFKGFKGEVEVVDALPHGSFVNEGDVVARFDAQAIDEQVVRAKMALERSELDMRAAEEDQRARREAEAEKLDAARSASERAAKRLRGYREHELKFIEESERMNLQARQHNLENQKDELDQLEKMYAEDELVDATEEIVLKRSRRRYAQSVQGHELAERRRIYDKEWYDPWREEDLVKEAETRAAGLQRLERSQEFAEKRDVLAMAQRRFDLEKQRRDLQDLVRDRDAFTVRAPRAGILMLANNGQIEKGTKLRSGASLGTVADAKKYNVETTVAEKDILQVKSGTAVEVVPTANADLKLMGRLRVDYLPGKNGFGAEVVLSQPDVRLRPGFTCEVEIILAEERDAVLVPKAALIERDGATLIRCGRTQDGPFEERAVVVGVVDENNASIRDGVAAGEFVAVAKGQERHGSEGK